MIPSSVLVTSNLFRFRDAGAGASSQNENVQWLASILRAALQDRVPVDVQLWKPGGGVRIEEVYRKAGITQDLDGYARLLDMEIDEVLDEVFEHQFDDRFVVGFELPAILRRYFSVRRIPYLDVVMGPIRFLPDLVPVMRSNQDEVTEILERHRTPDSDFYYYGHLRRAFFANRPRREIPPDSLLFVGQTDIDMSLYRNGRFIGVDDFVDEIAALAKKFDSLIFKPHPYASRATVRQQWNVLKSLGARYCEDNIYELMTHESVAHVVAISSSVTVEAPYLGSTAESLIPYPFDLAPPGEPGMGRLVPLYSKLASSMFWADLFDLDDVHEVNVEDGILAQTLGAAWGADVFRSGRVSRLDWLVSRLGLRKL
jgi:hypothetical protein